MKATLIAATLFLGFAVAGTTSSAQAAPLALTGFTVAQTGADSGDLLHTVRGGNRDNRASDGFRRNSFAQRRHHTNRNFNQRRNFARKGFGHRGFANNGFYNRGFNHSGFGHRNTRRGFGGKHSFGFFGIFRGH